MAARHEVAPCPVECINRAPIFFENANADLLTTEMPEAIEDVLVVEGQTVSMC